MHKRVLDVLIAFIILSLLFPLLLIIAYLVKRNLGKPIFFKQLRPGFNTKPFELIKFRTMLNRKDEQGNLLSDAKRLTRFGKFLRASSLDELPELWNVLKGEMSLVGPRPLLMEYLPLYNKKQASRHTIKPGITGWAQINGRNALTWEEKFNLDIWYVENRSFWLDCKILLLTVKQVILRKDITASCHVTTERFIGNHSEKG